ncbi:MAG: putative Ig domain-containing protein, partial [Myxococcota bacterium]
MRTPIAIVLAFSACSESAPEITTTDLPAGITNEVYSEFLTSTGGEAPVRWALAEGFSLPDGLTLNPAGAISGVPIRAGNEPFD